MKLKRILTRSLIIAAVIFSSKVMGAMLSDFSVWSGLYLGGNFGPNWGLLRNQLIIVNNTSNTLFDHLVVPGVEHTASRHIRSLRLTGGAQLGISHVYFERVMAGLELSYDAINLSQSIFNERPYLNTSLLRYYSIKTDSSASQLGTIRPRLGYFIRNYLPYVTAGGAVSKINFKQTFKDDGYNYTSTSSFHKTLLGWVVGTGIEYHPLTKLTFRLEYLYNQFRNQSMSHVYVGTGALNGLFANSENGLKNISIQTVLLGVNFYL